MIQVLTFLFSSTFYYIFLGILGVVIIYLLCKSFPDFKPVIKWGILTVILGCSVLSLVYCGNQLNGYYSAEGGIFGKITETLGFDIEHPEPQIFELKNLSLQSDAYGRYSATITLTDEKYLETLNPEKSYGIELNGQPTTSITDTSTHISASYSYTFYSELNKVLFSDDLYVSIALNDKSTTILIYTKNGDSLRYWKRYIQKNGFKLEIKESTYKKDKDVNVQNYKGTMNVQANLKSSEISLPADFHPEYVWSDGEKTYYSYGKVQFVLNGNLWEEESWQGMNSFLGNKVFSYKDKIYYADFSYVLNGKTWESCDIQIPSSLSSDYRILANSKVVYIFDKTSIFELKNTEFEQVVTFSKTYSPRCWWTDGNEFYYSNATDNFVLKNNSLEQKDWDWDEEMIGGYGYYFYTIAANVYYFNGNDRYIISDNKFIKIISDNQINFSSSDIWADRGKQYVVSGNLNYELSMTVSFAH